MRQIPISMQTCFATGIYQIIFLMKKAVYLPRGVINFLLYLTGFVRKLFDMTRLYDFIVFIILDLSRSPLSENNERGISRNKLIQYNCFAAKFYLTYKNYANSCSMLLTFENASCNRCTCRTRPVNNSLRYHRQER